MSVDQNTATSTRRRRRLVTAAAAVVTGLAVWVVSVPLLDVTLAITRAGEGDEVGVAPVLLTSLFAALAAWGLLALLEKFTARARTIWTIIAGVVLLLSLAAPIGSGTSVGAKLALLAMHLTVGAVIILGLRGSATAR